MGKKHIGLIDADLLDNGTRHPNIALMKISGYMEEMGHRTELLLNYEKLNDFDEVYLSKVFTTTKIPLDIPEYPKHIPNKFKKYPNLKVGGTGLINLFYLVCLLPKWSITLLMRRQGHRRLQNIYLGSSWGCFLISSCIKFKNKIIAYLGRKRRIVRFTQRKGFYLYYMFSILKKRYMGNR